MKIMTWNVDWYRNGKHSSGKNYIETDSLRSVYEKIKDVIEEFIDGNFENIVCLQEIPYKAKINCNDNHGLYNETLNCFKNKATFLANKNCCKRGSWSFARTMVISGDTWENSEDEYSGIKCNKIVQIEKNGIEIMVVHIPPIQMHGDDVYDAEDNRALWDAIIDKCKTSKPHIILGDFNTDDEKNEQYQWLQKMKEIGYCEPEGQATLESTFKESHIDYIIVREDLIDSVKEYKIFEEGVGLSDHKPLFIDIDI